MALKPYNNLNQIQNQLLLTWNLFSFISGEQKQLKSDFKEYATSCL